MVTGTASPTSPNCQKDGSLTPSPSCPACVYADRPVATAASAAYGAAWSWGQYGKYNDPEDPDFYEPSRSTTMLNWRCSC
jgi:hypothetical protein